MERALGNLPSSRPMTATWSNSRPFVPWAVASSNAVVLAAQLVKASAGRLDGEVREGVEGGGGRRPAEQRRGDGPTIQQRVRLIRGGAAEAALRQAPEGDERRDGPSPPSRAAARKLVDDG
jgi:hypothetical protein